MEYTKDLILNVHYSEVPKKFCMKNKRTSNFIKHIKRHKIIASSIIIASILMVIDGILIMNFIHIFESM